MKVLLAEDDLHIRQGLEELLGREGYRTVAAADGDEALRCYFRERPDFVLLDIMMPGQNGYDVCRQIRSHDPRVPVIFISAKSEEIDRVVGLELGADDFIVKPFGTKEVVARIRAVTRRCLADSPPSGGVGHTPNRGEDFAMGDLRVSPTQLRAWRGERQIELSLRDVTLLAFLYRQRGRVVSRDALYDHCWGRDYLPGSRTLDQHVSKLRKAVELDPSEPRIVRTVHGVGYRYDPD